MHQNPDIKVFLVYGSSASFEPKPYDLVYPDIEETYSPGMLLKTVAAMEHIDATLSYDYFVRTNIGTFWNFTALMQHLDELPSALTYSGDGPFLHEYVSGTDTIVNRHMITQLVKHKHELDYVGAEDHAMGKFFHGVMGAPFLKSRIFFMENFTSPDPVAIRAEIANAQSLHADHYRVKNMHDRDVIDIACYQELCRETYGIDLAAVQWET